MKRFLIQIAVFFALVAAIDVCCGFGFDYLKSHAKGGDTYKNYYLAEKCEDDVLILGSSRAARHYVPSVIKDSLGLSCYNAGVPGHGIIPAYAYYKMVVERHKPKLVIYEVTPEYDYYQGEDNTTYLGYVRQFIDNKPIKELYSTFGDGLDEIRFLSKMYRNNSKVVHNVMDQFGTNDDKGYEPLYGVMPENNTEVESKISHAEKKKIDSLKFDLLEKFIQETKEDNVQLVFIVSPSYSRSIRGTSNYYDAAIRLFEKYQIPFIDNSVLQDLSDHRELFQDAGHMNHKGSELFTRRLIPTLKEYSRQGSPI